ncbi:hypothetical Protein YC6258_00736 [Gynuella sunshinyii YC6258]|uniref:Uncharacterized protein n=1 Tax=Gynuella sunshinyii YC6258 TaxID=1445510 RepID=A0A0C5UZS3_9GAMM|nr:hypothetical Protein YC6258_00736 [Gynuella sunshinyii YC6258]
MSCFFIGFPDFVNFISMAKVVSGVASRFFENGLQCFSDMQFGQKHGSKMI